MTDQNQEPKPFMLIRHKDETGMSGVGKVAEGVVLPNGLAVMWWLNPPWTVSTYSSIDAVKQLHGHGERSTTDVVFRIGSEES